jgi:hypothetical protein
MTLVLIALLVAAAAVQGEQCNGTGSEEGGAVKPQALPKGISTWVYHYREGVARQVERYNAKARPEMRFSYLFPYAGSVAFGSQRGQATVHYRDESTHAYARVLPGILMLPIVDGRTDAGEFDGWTEEQYREAARQVADCVNNDPDAAGVQIDIEPFKPEHLPFYRHLRELLNAKGKYCTMFVGASGEEVLIRIFQSCDVVVISGYDMLGENQGAAAYERALRGALSRVQAAAEKTAGHYMVGIPAAASWGEYEYVAGGPSASSGSPPAQGKPPRAPVPDPEGPSGSEGQSRGGEAGRVETGVKQEEYVRAALEVVRPYRDSPEYLGLALWHMSDPETEFEQPEKATGPTKFPNVIRDSVWKMLESY